MSTLKAANLQNTGSGAPTVKNSSGTEIGQFALARCNFQGTGTSSIRDDFNVSTLTDNGTGDYTVTWSNNFSNTNYTVVFGGYNTYIGDGGWLTVCSQNSSNLWPTNASTSSIRINCFNNAGSVQDQNCVMLAAFGN